VDLGTSETTRKSPKTGKGRSLVREVNVIRAGSTDSLRENYLKVPMEGSSFIIQRSSANEQKEHYGH